jgi:hypothetical protein
VRQLNWGDVEALNSAVKMSPAMAAGIETRLWEMADLVRITDEQEAA